MLQPRRIAVRRSAQRIAVESGWELGKEVGYQIRFEKKLSSENRLVIITEGILANKIQGDPLLQDVSCIILDEFHERSIHTDFSVSWIKDLQKSKRKDLKLVVMSATMEAKEISCYLNDAPVLESEAKPFYLKLIHRNRPVTYQSPKDFYPALVSTIKTALKDHEKDVLAFLTGAGEINKTIGFLKKKDCTADFLPLYSRLSQEEQAKALKKGHRQRVVLATNIAETSLTVEGVGVVIDSGMEKILSFDPLTGAESLDIKRISKAAADQRAGRAAREGEGTCYRMWTLREEDKFISFLAPEIFRIDLTDHLLYLKALGIHDPLKWGWLSYPLKTQVQYAERALLLLRAINREGNVKDLGQTMALIPAGSRVSALLLYGYARGNIKDAALTAALLMERDFLKKIPRGSAFDISDCDMRMRKDIFQDIKCWSDQEVDWPAFHMEEVQEVLDLLMEEEKDPEKWTTEKVLEHMEVFLNDMQKDFLSKEAPEKITIPNARKKTITYFADRPPKVSAKIQEFFGKDFSPLIANGHCPVCIELLAPNNRPAQLTSNLKGFWQSGYTQIRKELQARYPKHNWPENPLKYSTGNLKIT